VKKFPKPSLHSRRKYRRNADNHKNRRHKVKLYRAWFSRNRPTLPIDETMWHDFNTEISRKIAKAFGLSSLELGIVPDTFMQARIDAEAYRRRFVHDIMERAFKEYDFYPEQYGAEMMQDPKKYIASTPMPMIPVEVKKIVHNRRRR